jgi:hypothetical protein
MWIGKNRNLFSFAIGFVEIVFIGLVSTVLILNKSDCEIPIRLWLVGFVGIFSTHFVLLSSSEIFRPFCSSKPNSFLSVVSAIINILLSIFIVLWFFVGNYWYYSVDEVCIDEFYPGYFTTFIILLFYYIGLGLACCTGCFLYLIAGLGKGLTTKSENFN